MDKQDTDKFVARARNGDMQAFEALILNHEKIVYNLAYRILQNEEDAKDISQEVFLRVYRYLDRFDGKSAFSTWLYRIAYNTCIDETRRRKNKAAYSIDAQLETEDSSMKQQYTDPTPTPEAQVLSKERQKRLLSAIESLPPDYKTALILRDLEGLSYSEISETMGLALGTVKSRIARARSQLKERILSERELLDTGPRQRRGKEG